MGNIQVMSAALANQIAAGEVLERPASCVKELVENSLDALAKSITVRITEGGIASILVEDDGVGMDEEDAPLAFARHATSKISHSRDLFRIATLGFRGEALASIAAVSRVTLRSKTADSETGIELTVEGTDEVSAPTAVGMGQGTAIEVKDLFFNTPARLKYLRSVATEQARCVEVVQKAALSRPDVAFRCIVNDYTVFQTAGNGRVEEVLAAVYGVAEAKQFIPFEGTSADYTIKGFIGRPTQAKSSRVHGHLFANQRPIRNLALHQAVCAGYQSRLMVNRHPMYVLYVELSPSLVDVNIHPHKAEVRFSEERDLTQLITSRVKEALDDTFLVPTVGFGQQQSATAPVNEEQSSLNLIQPATYMAESNANWSYPAGSKSMTDAPQKHVESAVEWPRSRSNSMTQESIKVVLGPSVGVETQPQPNVLQPHETKVHETVASFDATRDSKPSSWRLRPVGQALGMYIIADDGERLYIIDQHAAHERVLFEKFSKRLERREIGQIPLLTPIPMTLTPLQHASAMSNREMLMEMGIEIEEFGGYDIVIRTVPDLWEGLDSAKMSEQLIQDLVEQSGRVDVRRFLHSEVVMRACKAAIKANYYLSSEEIAALCEAMSDLDDPFHCPHGRPIAIKLTSRDLEKEFRRIV